MMIYKYKIDKQGKLYYETTKLEPKPIDIKKKKSKPLFKNKI